MFVIKLRFPASNSIIQTLRILHDNRLVKFVRHLEKLDFKTRKCNIDLEFFNLCVENNTIPKFIQFRVANKKLRNSVAYRECLNKLLQQEFINKKQRYRLLEGNLKSVKDKLLLSVNLFGYNYVCKLFPGKNGISLRSHQKIHSKKLLALTKLTTLLLVLNSNFWYFLKIRFPNRRIPVYLKVSNLSLQLNISMKLNIWILCYHLDNYIET